MPQEIEIPLGFRLNLDYDVLVSAAENNINIDSGPRPNHIYAYDKDYMRYNR